MKQKKLLALVLAGAMALSMAACGGTATEETTTETAGTAKDTGATKDAPKEA